MESKQWPLRVNKRLFTIGLLILITAMVMATQFAVTKIGYDYHIVHPSNANIRFIGSDNASDGFRLIRVYGNNSTGATLELSFGNLSANQNVTYTAAFGIVNEESLSINITHINVTSTNWTYMKIWVHGTRYNDADRNISNTTGTLMYTNGTLFNLTNITAWTLAPGNNNASDMCSNVSDRANNSFPTPWDTAAHVRYSVNDTNATAGVSDYVWIQIRIDIPSSVDYGSAHTGTILIHFEADRFS
jgi:hypothetical protein